MFESKNILNQRIQSDSQLVYFYNITKINKNILFSSCSQEAHVRLTLSMCSLVKIHNKHQMEGTWPEIHPALQSQLFNVDIEPDTTLNYDFFLTLDTFFLQNTQHFIS